jgi:hypothetical protein
MTEKIELIKGGGNVFRDFGYPAADVEQLKGILAAKIIGVLDDRKLSVRKAEGLTGVKEVCLTCPGFRGRCREIGASS